MVLGKLLKDIAPVLIGATLGPAVAGTTVSPFISRAAEPTSKLMGGKTKDALRNALIAGVGGAVDRFSGGEQVVNPNAGQTIVRGAGGGGQGTGEFLRTGAKTSGSAVVPTEAATKGIVETFKPKTFSAELLKSAGVGGIIYLLDY